MIQDASDVFLKYLTQTTSHAFTRKRVKTVHYPPEYDIIPLKTQSVDYFKTTQQQLKTSTKITFYFSLNIRSGIFWPECTVYYSLCYILLCYFLENYLRKCVIFIIKNILAGKQFSKLNTKMLYKMFIIHIHACYII